MDVFPNANLLTTSHSDLVPSHCALSLAYAPYGVPQSVLRRRAEFLGDANFHANRVAELSGY